MRDIVYQDQDETTFHNQADVHYGRFAHTTIALSVAFASLELLINYFTLLLIQMQTAKFLAEGCQLLLELLVAKSHFLPKKPSLWLQREKRLF